MRDKLQYTLSKRKESNQRSKSSDFNKVVEPTYRLMDNFFLEFEEHAAAEKCDKEDMVGRKGPLVFAGSSY